ncbi:MAG: DUF2066 domain-containing protein [Magnetococcus sp. WYHC-3]
MLILRRFVLILLLSSLGAAPAGAAASGEDPFYWVAGIQVSQPLDHKDPRKAAFARAESLALARLLERMLDGPTRQAHAATLAPLLAKPHPLVVRTVVRSEKNRPDALFVQVDILFNGAPVRQTLEQAGLPFNQTPYPAALLLTPQSGDPDNDWGTLADDDPAWIHLQEAAREQGITLVRPLGDVNDLSHLSLASVRAGDAALSQWLRDTYAAEQVWEVVVSQPAPPGGSGVASPQEVSCHLTIHGRGAPPPLEIRRQITAADPAAARAGLMPDLGRSLVAKIMDHWIQRHQLAPGANTPVVLVVEHHHDMGLYGRFLAELAHVPGLVEVRTARLGGGRTELHGRYRGEITRLQESLQEIAPFVAPEGGALLVRLVGNPRTMPP